MGRYVLSCLIICLLVLSAGHPVEAAGRDGLDREQEEDIDSQLTGSLVGRIQKDLAELGYYLGAIDHRTNEALDAAIRRYQRESELEVDGQPSVALANHLARTLRMAALIDRLAKSRREGEKSARRKLTANPLTRRLLQDPRPPEAPEMPDVSPEINAKTIAPIAAPCLVEPTPACVLGAAERNSRLVKRPDQRDWVLGEVLSAQARAGLGTDALMSTRLIRDPRLVMVALRNIAAARARAGAPEDALFAAELIPDTHQQMEALSEITRAHLSRGALEDAQDAAQLLNSMVRHVRDLSVAARMSSEVALLLHQAKAPHAANRAIARAITLARDRLQDSPQETALREAADTLAGLGRIDDARELLMSVHRSTDRVSVQLAMAEAETRAGKLDAALATLNEVSQPRYRLQGLARIAEQQTADGDLAAAQRTLETGFRQTSEIRKPFARSFAQRRLVQAQKTWALAHKAPLTPLLKAVGRAAEIADPRLRAEALFELAADLREIGEYDPVLRLVRDEARNAAEEIKSGLARSWLHADQALLYATRGHPDWSDIAVGQALRELHQSTDAWTRARGLAKLAQVLMSIEDR